jgi:glucosamine-6-phosphate deaminase
MEVVVQLDPDKVCKYAASVVAEQIRKKPTSVFGLAAGSSQLGMYLELIRLHREEGLDFSQVKTFNLDEYVGLPPDHPCSYHSVMTKNFFSHINIPESNIHIPDGMSKDIGGECDQYEAEIRKAGGIDIGMLGVGADGHIGFNEPTSSLGSRTRLKMLTEKTRYDNSRFFSTFDDVPRHVITMGVGTIMDSRRVMLIAFGKQKADIITRLVEGPVTSIVPASVIQFHPKAKVVVDEAAAQKLKLKHYYKWAFEQKPKWQGL